MWPFSLYRKIRHLNHLLENFRETNTDQADHIDDLMQRMSRMASKNVELIDNAVGVKPVSSATEEMVKAA